MEFAHSKSAPLLLIDPFRLDVLRQRGVTRVDAQLAIGADGAVAQVDLLPDSVIPASLTRAVHGVRALLVDFFFRDCRW